MGQIKMTNSLSEPPFGGVRGNVRTSSIGDTWTFKADIAFFIFALIFKTSGPKMAIFRGKIGEGVGRYWPPTNLFLLLGVYTSVSNLVKIDKEMRPWEWRHTDRQTDRHTHRLTDANRFYYLSHAICYSYGTDNESESHVHWRCGWRHGSSVYVFAFVLETDISSIRCKDVTYNTFDDFLDNNCQ